MEIEFAHIPEIDSLYSGCVLEPADKELFHIFQWIYYIVNTVDIPGNQKLNLSLELAELGRHNYLPCFPIYPARWPQTKE